MAIGREQEGSHVGICREQTGLREQPLQSPKGRLLGSRRQRPARRPAGRRGRREGERGGTCDQRSCGGQTVVRGDVGLDWE